MYNAKSNYGFFFVMSVYEHIKWITTPSSRVSPHLLRKGDTLGSRTLGIVLSLCHLSMAVFECMPSTGVLLSGATRLTALPYVAIRSSVPYGTPFLAAAAARVPFLNKWVLALTTLAQSECVKTAIFRWRTRKALLYQSAVYWRT